MHAALRSAASQLRPAVAMQGTMSAGQQLKLRQIASLGFGMGFYLKSLDL
jgi:hypothetical protein